MIVSLIFYADILTSFDLTITVPDRYDDVPLDMVDSLSAVMGSADGVSALVDFGTPNPCATLSFRTRC